MTTQKLLKLVHFGSTGWLGFSIVYMMIVALLQAGKSWWVIISLSGYSTVIGFLLVSLYLFALFRGADRSQKIEKEHPLTASNYYLFFYDACPVFGAFAGWVSAVGFGGASHYMLFSAAGSLAATFLVWIIIDPAAGLVEMMLPGSRNNRRERVAAAKDAKDKENAANTQLLAGVELNENMERENWGAILCPYAERLAVLAGGGCCVEDGDDVQRQAVDIGLAGWEIGGLNCMRQLHSMTMEMCRRNGGGQEMIDHVSIWWDGVGSWRSRWQGEKSWIGEF